MDPDSGAGPTEQVPAEPALTAYHQGATGDAAPQFALAGLDTWASGPPLDTQSRNSLRQASAALDTAYERITSLRNSINDMLNRIPPEGTGTGATTTSTDNSTAQPRPALTHDTSIRPPHSALVLSSEQVVEELNMRAARLRSLISPSTRQRLEDFESSSRQSTRRELSWDIFAQGDRPRLDMIDLHPALPQRRTPPMLNPVQPRASQRRDFQNANQDDSSTMIGRRVAARVNAPDSANPPSRLSLSQIEQRLQAQTAQIARELENMTDRLAAQRSRRAELASSSVRGDTPGVATDIHALSQVGPATTGRSVANPPAGRRPLGRARDLTLADNATRIVLPQPISRTSSDGTPIDELFPSARRSLSAAFREHIATHHNHVQGGQSSQDSPLHLANSPEVRGTLVNLLARDRDDQFQPVRQAEHIRPGVDSSRRDGGAPVRSNPSSPAGQGRRRRGWTRLNADGDEINSDEDEAVSPHTRRLRMRFAYGMNVDQPAARSHTVTIEDILWRTSGSDSEADALSPDSTESCQSLFQGSPPRPWACRPHPLPTPAEEMLIYPSAKPLQHPRAICVSKYASLAGR